MVPFLLDAQPYLSKPPYFTHKQTGGWGGNAILETAQYLLIKKLIVGLNHEDSWRIWGVYNDALHESGKPGLLGRGSHKKLDPQRHDDIVGFSAVAGIIEPILAWRVYNYGKNHRWYYKLPHLRGIKEWFNGLFWRMPGVVQAIKMGAGARLTAWDQFWLFIELVGGIFAHNGATSDRLMDWCIIMLYEERSPRYRIVDIGVSIWKWDIRRRYPGLIGDVFSIYYGKDHLFAKYMNGRITTLDPKK